MAYSPDESVLARYADVLVNFALGHGAGIKHGDVVLLSAYENAKPLYVACRDAVLRAGGTIIGDYVPTGIARSGLELSSKEQLEAFPRAYYRGLAKAIDHHLIIWSSSDLHELEGVDPEKIILQAKSLLPYRSWLSKKENEGDYSWTIALYGTSALAREAQLSLKDYWQQIIDACYLDDSEPCKRWRETKREIDRVKRRLDRLQIERLHVEAEGVDLWVGLGAGRKWLGGDGANIPSFEVFISPDWRLTEGVVSFNEPLYRYGSLIESVRLRFQAGEVVEASASRNEALLLSMLESDAGARRAGEFSLTDGRLSRITRFMAETLFDENRGGPEGNFHVALGEAYKDAYTGDPASLRKADWKRLGYNESVIHTDIVSTSRRTVTATLPSGRQKVIYRDGRFTV
jgi:aminopeptidase